MSNKAYHLLSGIFKSEANGYIPTFVEAENG